MTVPPTFSTFSAATELVVTAVVVWFFYRALRFGDYRFGLMSAALVYETAFNITYMVSRIFLHEEGVTHVHEPWVTWFVAFHGSLSLGMFIGLIWITAWGYRSLRRGNPNPLLARKKLSITFLVLWGVSVTTGEMIYAMYWLDLIGPGSG
jgi:hypothetical protein